MSTDTTEQITLELIEQYRSWKPDAVAVIFTARLKAIEQMHKTAFSEVGIIGLECKRRELWKLVADQSGKPFESWTDWMYAAMPVSSGKAFESVTVAETLEWMPVEQRHEIAPGNLKTMSKLSTALARTEKIREAAKTLTPGKFLQMIETDHPEQHIEAKMPMQLKPERSQRNNIDLAIDMAMLLEECKTREEALDAICGDYRERHSAAYERARKEARTMVQ